MSERKSKNVYKNFCEENRIRYALDDCGNPISPSRVRKFGADHLWWTGTDDGKIGVSVERHTPATYKGIKKKISRGRLCTGARRRLRREFLCFTR
jgi:hypothetical protein